MKRNGTARLFAALLALVMVAVLRKPLLFGDANCDGKITAADAAAVLRAVVGLSTLPARSVWNADADGSGDIKTADAVTILRYVVKLIDTLPAA